MASTSFRIAGLAAVLAGLFVFYVSGALGIVGAGHRADLLFLAAPVVGLVVALGFGFRARGLAVGMAVAAAVTVLVGLGAITAGLHRVDGASVAEILGLSVMFAALWASSSWLYSRAADQRVGLQPPHD